MKKMSVLIAAILTLSTSPATLAMAHESMQMDHDCGMMAMGKQVHEEITDGVKATFRVIDIKAKMKEFGMKETHHIMVFFSDPRNDGKLSQGEVTVKVQGPDKSEQVKDLMGMEGGFGAYFTMPVKGKYGVTAKFRLKDGKNRSVKFWYTVK